MSGVEEMYEYHPIASLFPMLEGDRFNDLKEDIRANGLHEPIVLYEGKVLDGRNRLSACIESGEQPRFSEYSGDDPIGYVLSLNLHRRHLNESQRAMVAAKVANMRPGARTDIQPSANLREVGRTEAAGMLNVSERSVTTAKAVQSGGSESLINAVESGRVSVSAAADVATLGEEEQSEIVARGEKEILEASKRIRAEKANKRRTERIEKIAEISAGNTEISGDRTYPVIYADPPWKYQYSETESRAIENQYPTMDLEDICKLKVPSSEDAILFLWVTAPKVDQGLKVMNSWGFTYKSCAVWDKQKMGMGYYFRVQHELLLIGVKGDIPTPTPENRPRSILSVPYDGHSSKPSEMVDIIERMYPELPKIELFCREKRQSWDAWGNQSA